MMKVPSTAKEEFKDRFWSLVLTAKYAKKRVGVFFDENNQCQIGSFFAVEGD